ncbi:MAG: hypothetical protein WBH55_00005, partial [Bacteroidota bacterium]
LETLMQQQLNILVTPVNGHKLPVSGRFIAFQPAETKLSDHRMPFWSSGHSLLWSLTMSKREMTLRGTMPIATTLKG